MNKKFIIIGSLSILTFAGCQNIADEMTKKMVEGVVNTASNGELKLDIKDLEKGQISVTTKEGVMDFSGDENGGTVKLTDNSGKVIVDANSDGKNVLVKGEDGKTLVEGSEEGQFNINTGDGENLKIASGKNGVRPQNIPDYLPSVKNANNFVFMNSAGTEMLSFEVNNGDLKEICDQQIELLKNKGWEDSSVGFNVAGGNLQMSTMTREDNNLSITCNQGDDGVVRVNLGVGPKY